MNEIDLCADWKDKYKISLQNRARKYIYVWTFVWYYSHTRPMYAIRLIFSLDLTRWKWNPLQKKIEGKCNGAYHFYLQNNACWRDEHCVCLSAKCVFQKKTPIVSHYIEDCILVRKKTKIKVIRHLLHKHTIISSSIKE